MNIQRIRNLTTGKLHTHIGDVYQDMEYIIGERGVMTHMIPNIFRALKPWLMDKVQDSRCWNDMYDPGHHGDMDLSPMTQPEKNAFFSRLAALPSPFDG